MAELFKGVYRVEELRITVFEPGLCLTLIEVLADSADPYRGKLPLDAVSSYVIYLGLCRAVIVLVGESSYGLATLSMYGFNMTSA